MTATGDPRLDRLDPRDRAYAEGLPEDEREVVVSTVSRYRRPDRLEVGDPLPALAAARLEDGSRLELRDLAHDRPLLLVFGSFTWPPFRRRSGDVEQLYRRYRERANAVFLYVAEAHAVDEWQMQANVDEGVLLRQHASLEERFAAAREGVARLGLTMPVAVDGMDDAVSQTFAAWPERLYVADRGGRLAYVGGPGPFEFDPEAAEEALAALVAQAPL